MIYFAPKVIYFLLVCGDYSSLAVCFIVYSLHCMTRQIGACPLGIHDWCGLSIYRLFTTFSLKNRSKRETAHKETTEVNQARRQKQRRVAGRAGIQVGRTLKMRRK